MRILLILYPLLLLSSGCSPFFGNRGGKSDTYPIVAFEMIHVRAGGLLPQDHVALARWDDDYYYFEWRRIVEPATMKTREGSGRVAIREFDRKNGEPLERKVGVIGKEDLNSQLYNAGPY